MNKQILMLAGVLAGASAASASVTFSDGVFASGTWTSSLVANANGVGSTFNSAQFLNGGNPNEYLQIVANVQVSGPNGGAFLLFMNNTAFYNPVTSGAVSAIDYSEDSINFLQNSGDGMITGLAITQGGKTYVQRNPLLVMPYPTFNTWGANASPGLNPSDLWELDSTGVLHQSSNPDWSASGGAMQMGFYRAMSSGNSTSSFVREAGIDNWNVRIIPAPGVGALLALAGAASMRRRRS
ncbi:MAG: hypothetical protein ABL309_12950 [Phycisphaerales bacterium]